MFLGFIGGPVVDVLMAFQELQGRDCFQLLCLEVTDRDGAVPLLRYHGHSDGERLYSAV